ncbi:uncharacterized protein LOC108033524 [Drosophila biarmipes]|uniref:uncharacterized protein LOC108033524 n=1 Tax=Drosophila biarmipes TaxID=125945 RepID=UPI0007E5E503|nr:uncharacterized protein LOC108033524 [Drosophila biarmipes]
MEGILKWFIAALACCLVTELGGQYYNPDFSVQDYTNETETRESFKEEIGNQKALKHLKLVLDAQLAINSDLRSEVRQRSAYLQYVNQGVAKAKLNWTKTRNAVLKARQVLAQKKVKVDYSWLLMERCQSTKYREDKVRRLAERLADKQSDEFHPLARKYFLVKYLRILKDFEDQIVQETRAGMGLSRKRRPKKVETSNSADIV